MRVGALTALAAVSSKEWSAAHNVRKVRSDLFTEHDLPVRLYTEHSGSKLRTLSSWRLHSGHSVSEGLALLERNIAWRSCSGHSKRLFAEQCYEGQQHVRCAVKKGLPCEEQGLA